MSNHSDNIFLRFADLLIHEKKFSEIGRLTSGILHNLNTPISIIQGNAELLRLRYSDLQEINMIIRQVERINELIQEIGTKSKNSLDEKPIVFSLNELLTNELQILEANLYFKHNVKVNLVLDENFPKIEAVYSEFSMIVSALLKNAVDSMYKRENRNLDIKTLKTNNELSLSVKDSGMGMTKDIIDKMFEPFYSTKPHPLDTPNDSKVPYGIGIDLYLADLLIKKNNLKLKVTSDPETGSDFTLIIPSTK